jgi:hypothetical protein
VLANGSWATTPIERAWGPFFPDVAEHERRDHRYPVPLSEEFWMAYAESIDTFIRGADVLYQAVLTLGASDASDAPDLGRNLDLDLEHPRGEAHRALFSLLAGCTPALVRDSEGKHARAFHAKSLLASLAMMAYLDLTSGKRVLRCDEDYRPFISGAYQARYCSDRCRNRALKRAYRERHRAADTDDERAIDTEDAEDSDGQTARVS